VPGRLLEESLEAPRLNPVPGQLMLHSTGQAGQEREERRKLTAKAQRTQRKKIKLCGVGQNKITLGARFSSGHTAKPELAYPAPTLGNENKILKQISYPKETFYRLGNVFKVGAG